MLVPIKLVRTANEDALSLVPGEEQDNMGLFKICLADVEREIDTACSRSVLYRRCLP